METSRATSRPIAFFALTLPSGVSSGYVTVTLPYLLSKAGFPVAVSASIVAAGVSANLWRFLWGPIADATLTLRHWYLIALATTASTLLALSLVPLKPELAALITAMVFISQVAGTLILLPLGGLMALTVPDEAKGRAAGWYQAGNLGGTGLGGGAGLWLATHASVPAAGVVLAVCVLFSAYALRMVPHVPPALGDTLSERVRGIGRDFRELTRSRMALLTMALVATPIAACMLTSLWSAVANDWKASADNVALVTGAMSAVVVSVGCVVGGWFADRFGRWWAYFGTGVLAGLPALAMAVGPRTPTAYDVGVLFYAFTNGLAYAAFSAIVLAAIGRGAASTKYALLGSIGNIPCVYMLAIDGNVHDRFGVTAMLNVDALSSIAFVALGLLALWKVQGLVYRPRVRAAVGS